ncbi:PQQ-dependent sugar dehydrogenase [Saccharospirillum impatiens]|uniref:PQQ-dependent sugar dehydrogenase n=1 Tax=Saccharospirillum impatiens TaxID=169438 RepID=UPI0003FB8F3A|nr:PQQ-dependent sugar dehydrogenase [Saccharospirillum impatiens]
MNKVMRYRLMSQAAICVFSGTLLLPSTALAEPLTEGSSLGHDYQVEEIANGFSAPWGMTFVSDTELVITGRGGQLWILDTGSKTRTELSGLPDDIATRGQGGLLDVQASPSFSSDKTLYFTYSKTVNNGAATTLARALLSSNNRQLTQWEDLLVTDSASSAGQHFGSRVTFDNDGYVYFGVGDRGDRDNGQDFSNHAASIMRLHQDGRVPDDNPFVSDSGIPNEIWSLGHRNPQGLVFDEQRNMLWEIEHGPRGGDEINVIEPGGNYGWPVVSHGREYWGPVDVGEAESLPGYIDPVKVYVPSIAPGSLIVYQGEAFPGWQGHLFAGALVLTHLNHIEVTEQGGIGREDRLLDELGERIRAVAEDHRGHLYLSTDSGRILRISPANS